MGNIKNKVSSKEKQKEKQIKNKKKHDIKVINELTYQAPKLRVSKKINNISKMKIQDENNVQDIFPRIFSDFSILKPIKHIYQILFRLLGKFGENQFKKSKRQIVKHLRRRQ